MDMTMGMGNAMCVKICMFVMCIMVSHKYPSLQCRKILSYSKTGHKPPGGMQLQIALLPVGGFAQIVTDIGQTH
jgi:hypothetical protein